MTDSLDAAAGFDRVYGAIAGSTVYREAIRSAIGDVPDWLVPYSVTRSDDLACIAKELRVGSGDSFVDLGCGMGGPGVWVCENTHSSLVGVDFAPSAVAAAQQLARQRGLGPRARFVAADATSTGLPAGAFAGVMSIDSIQFMDPYAVAAEIARLVAPGGVAVIRTWEALLDDLPLATIVRDYRPVLESAGLMIAKHEDVPDFRSRELPLYRALQERAEALRREIGDVAESILEEARNMLAKAQEPPRVRKVFIVAKLTEAERLS